MVGTPASHQSEGTGGARAVETATSFGRRGLTVGPGGGIGLDVDGEGGKLLAGREEVTKSFPKERQ